MLEPYPLAAEYPPDPQAEAEIAWLQSFILAVRQIRGEMDINPAKRIPVLVKEPSAGDVYKRQRQRSPRATIMSKAVGNQASTIGFN